MRPLRSVVVVWTAALALVGCSEANTGSPGGGADGTFFGDGSSIDAASGSDGGVDIGGGADDTSAVTCQEVGQLACFNATAVKVCNEALEWQFATKCDDGQVCVKGVCNTAIECTPGETIGCDGYTTEVVCADTGASSFKRKCPGKQQCAAGKCRDVVCTPGFDECVDPATIKKCLDDGSGFGEPTKCKSGSVCFGGKCVSQCEDNIKVNSNIGCEYWAADLDNATDTFSAALNPDGLTPDMIPHSVVIANPGQFDAEVTIEIAVGCNAGAQCQPVTNCGGKKTTCEVPVATPYAIPFADKVVKAGATREFKIPVMNVDGSGKFRKGIHIKSTQPVVAYQFNPFNAEGAATNDGSLLLPINVLGKTYFAVALGSRPDIGLPGLPNISQNGYLTVVATEPGDTTVEITPTVKVIPPKPAQAGWPSTGNLDANKPYTWTLKQYEVLSLQSLGEITFGGATDLTGTKIVGSKKIAVFCGHEEAVIGNDQGSGGSTDNDSCCAEHVEEQMMPVESWGTELMAVKTRPRGGELDHYYFVAGEDNVTITTIPPIANLSGKTLKKAGDYIKVESAQSFFVKASGKIQGVQFIVSRGQTQQGTGDPTMFILPPKKQYRTDYVIQTAEGYKSGNWLSIIRPAGLDVSVDGNLVPANAFSPFGDGTWELGYYEVQTGSHVIEAADPFGLMVYGYGNATAYGYPGGMNLQ